MILGSLMEYRNWPVTYYSNGYCSATNLNNHREIGISGKHD